MLRKLHKTGPNIWQWDLAVRVDGRRIHRHIECTEAEAHRIHAELLDARARASVGLPHATPAASPKLADAAARYSREQLAAGKVASHVEDINRVLNVLRTRLGDDWPVARITREHVIGWRDARSSATKRWTGRPITARTVNKGLAELSGFLRWCCNNGWLDINPASTVPRIKQTAPPAPILLWRDYERLATLAWQRPHFGIFLEALAETGARIGELFRARVADLDEKTKTWSVIVKGGRRLTKTATPWLLHALTHAAGETLLPREDGQPWTMSMIRKAIAGVCKTAGLPYHHPHVFRHARAAWSLAEGANPRTVQIMLGHTSVTTTERYLRSAEIVGRAEPGVVHTRPVSVCLLCVSERRNGVQERPATERHGTPRKQHKPRTSGELRIKSSATKG